MKLNEARILVVDDEPELLEIFSLWLGRSGCTVKTAANGADALKILTGENIDALITDIRMPVMDGLTLVRRISELGLNVPSIIFVSGFGDVNVREAYSLGVEAMLPKPLPRNALVKKLEDSLKERGELWLTPMESTPETILEVTENSLSDAWQSCDFQLGRGGCCLTYPTSLAEDVPVRFTVCFSEDHLKLSGEGVVRWFDAKDSHVGIEFTYLEPECRSWVLDRMRDDMLSSFIPRCAVTT